MHPAPPPSLYEDLSSLRDVECIFPDANGVARGKLRPAADCAAGKPLNVAQAILLQTVTGDYADDRGVGDTDDDMLLLPDWTTFRRLPWREQRGILIHDCADPAGNLLEIAPRTVLKRVLGAYAARGWEAVVAPELEFYLFDARGSSDQAFALPAMRDGTCEVAQSAYSVDSAHELAAFWAEVDTFTAGFGLPTDTWLHEMGPSQFEINLLHGDPLQAADQVVLFKYALREAAARHGLRVVFMAKPVAGQPGSSMHLHQSVIKADGSNLFSAVDGSSSMAFRHYLGGLQAYLPELMAFFAPYVNSWRRYVRDSGAPVNVEWGIDNRTAGLRVPRAESAARRVENRLPGSDANPYLAIAASLAAGLAGMEEALEPRPDISAASAYHAARTLPDGLHAALRVLAASRMARQYLGAHFIEAWCAVKIKELDHCMAEVSVWDRRFLARAV